MTNEVNFSKEWENWFCRRGSQKWLEILGKEIIELEDKYFTRHEKQEAIINMSVQMLIDWS